MTDQHESTPGPNDANVDRERMIDDPAIEHAVTALEATPADDLAGRLDAGERLHHTLTERMSQTGRDGG